MLSVSLWFALVTVVPGLVTIAVVWLGAVVVLGHNFELPKSISAGELTLAIAVATAAMVMTQSFGVLLEDRVLVQRRWLGRGRRWERTLRREVDPFVDPTSTAAIQRYTIDPYEEYEALYLVLTSLRKDEDAHGHFQRVVAQFFLTLNSMVALAIGVCATVAMLLFVQTRWPGGAAYVGLLLGGIATLWLVAANRFALLGWGLWATRRRRGMPNSDGKSAHEPATNGDTE